jgi:hypothetical protein
MRSSGTRPAFCEHTLLPLDLRTLGNYVIEPVPINESEVDLSKVVWIFHPSYQRHTWKALLPPDPPVGFVSARLLSYFPNVNCLLKRGDDNMRWLRKNPDYYLSAEKKVGWSFLRINDLFYLDCGVHRTIIGRFFLHLNGLPEIIRGASVSELKFVDADRQHGDPGGTFVKRQRLNGQRFLDRFF